MFKGSSYYIVMSTYPHSYIQGKQPVILTMRKRDLLAYCSETTFCTTNVSSGLSISTNAEKLLTLRDAHSRKNVLI